MSTPEIEPRGPWVEHRPEQLDANQSRELGVSPTPVAPPTLKNDNGQVVAQSVGDVPTIAIPISQVQAQAFAKGNVANASTWFGRVVVRNIKKAILGGFRIILKSKNG